MALHDVSIAICGGHLSPKINEREIPRWKSIVIKKGQILSFGELKEGARTYISMAGGIDVPFVLNSKSTYLTGKFGGFEGRALKEGDTLFGNPCTRRNRFLHTKLIPKYTNPLTVRVIAGPHTDKFTKIGIETFLTKEYSISTQSNRMGYQLEGPKLNIAVRLILYLTPSL